MVRGTNRSTAPSVLVLECLVLAVSVALVVGQSSGNGLNNAGTIQNSDRLSTFANELDSVGLSPSRGKTIFAPINAAFTQFINANPNIAEKYLTQDEWILHKFELLDWGFVTEGDFTIAQIFDGSRAFLENSNGNITIRQNARGLDNIDDGNLVDVNIRTNEGIIHMTDKIIVPPRLTQGIMAQLFEDYSYKFAFTTMASLALFAELDDELDAIYENGLTLLAPPNRRFVRAEIDVQLLLTEEMKDYTRDFVRAHMTLGNHFESAVWAYQQHNDVDQQLVLSFLGTHMWITTTTNILRFQSRRVLLTDQLTRNGLFHVMDYPLFPPFCSDVCAFTFLSTDQDTSDMDRFFKAILMTSEDIALMYNTTLTVFAPTREAFTGLFNSDFERLLEPIWVRHATEFVFNHISRPAMTRAELYEMAPTTITMLNDQVYDLRRSRDDIPMIVNNNEEGRLTFGDIIALDGYVHVMDSIITPTAVSLSIYTWLEQHPDYSLLVENIDFVRLTRLVDRDLPLTMFTPNNDAFRRITFSTIEGGDIINSHIFRGLLFTDVLANTTAITSVNGIGTRVELRGVGTDNLEVWVGGGLITKGDILVRNGVIHHIDRVFGFEYPTASPTISPAPTITAMPTVYEEPTAAPIPVPTGAKPFIPPPIPRPVLPPAERPTEEPVADAAMSSSLFASFIVTAFAAVYMIM